MSEKCKYCDYVSKCSRFCEYNSIMCLMHRSFPKIVDKTYEELEKENKKYKEVIDKATSYVEQHAITVTDGTITTNKRELLDILKRWNK